MNRCLLSLALVPPLLFVAGPGCSKSAKKEEPRAANANGPGALVNDAKTPKIASDDLDKAIAKPGKKLLTAIGTRGEPKVLEVDGATVLAETATYVVKAAIPSEVDVGQDSVVGITLLPKEGWHINQEFPTKLTLSAPEGVALKTLVQTAKEAAKFSEDEALFNVSFQPKAAGDKAFAAEFRFAVCTDSTCDPKKATLAWNLTAK